MFDIVDLMVMIVCAVCVSLGIILFAHMFHDIAENGFED